MNFDKTKVPNDLKVPTSSPFVQSFRDALRDWILAQRKLTEEEEVEIIRSAITFAAAGANLPGRTVSREEFVEMAETEYDRLTRVVAIGLGKNVPNS